MATVKFSKELQENIKQNAQLVHKAQITKAIEAFKTEWFETIYNRVYAPYLPHMNALPNEFFLMLDEVTLTKFGDVGLEVRMKLPRDYKFPRSQVPNLLLMQDSWRASQFLVKDDNMWGTLADDIYAYQEAVNKLKAQSNEFVEAVTKIITTYSTLAPALRAWPPLWDLLPSHTQERHKLVEARVKADIKLDDSLDLGKLTSAVVMHKLTR